MPPNPHQLPRIGASAKVAVLPRASTSLSPSRPTRRDVSMHPHLRPAEPRLIDENQGHRILPGARTRLLFRSPGSAPTARSARAADCVDTDSYPTPAPSFSIARPPASPETPPRLNQPSRTFGHTSSAVAYALLNRAVDTRLLPHHQSTPAHASPLGRNIPARDGSGSSHLRTSRTQT